MTLSLAVDTRARAESLALLAVAAAVVLADALTKTYLATAPAFLHHVDRPGMAWLLFLIGWAGVVTVTQYRPAALILAGVACNSVDAMDGAVENPFVVAIGHVGIGVNAADVALALGTALMIVGTVRAIRGRRR